MIVLKFRPCFRILVGTDVEYYIIYCNIDSVLLSSSFFSLDFHMSLVPSQNPSVVGNQAASGTSQETVSEVITRFHRWLRSEPTGEELHAGATTYSPINQTTDTTRDSESQGGRVHSWLMEKMKLVQVAVKVK